MTLRLLIATIVLLVVPGLLAAAAQESESTEQATLTEASYARGFSLFQRYCRSCHGKKGVGDGHVAKYLKIPPSDLTRLSADNGGEFPTERVIDSIDGREGVPLHGRDMPIWGAVFQVDEGQTEADVQLKLNDLVEYLKVIQVEEPAAAAEPQQD